MKNKKKLIFTLLIAAVGIIIFVRVAGNIQKAIFMNKAAAVKKAAVPESGIEEAVQVKGFKVKKMEFKDTLPCIGNVKGFKEINLKFQTSGIIENFNFEEGEKIQEGDIIASLVQREALLKLKYAELELAKNQKLFELGAISQTKLEQSKLEYESARSELDKTNIYAASNGLLGSKIIDAGSYVTPNENVGIFVSIDRIYAEFNIIEKDVPKIALGQKAEVFADVYPNSAFEGTVDSISPIIEGRSRTETLKIVLDNKNGALKPGMFIRALIATYEKKDAIIIPASGLKKKEADYFIYVIHKEEIPPEGAVEGLKVEKAAKKPWWAIGGFMMKKKEAAKGEGSEKEKKPEYGAIEVRKIKIGYMTQDLVEIDEGLKEDELIAIEAMEDFKDKAKVEIAEVQEGVL